MTGALVILLILLLAIIFRLAWRYPVDGSGTSSLTRKNPAKNEREPAKTNRD